MNTCSYRGLFEMNASIELEAASIKANLYWPYFLFPARTRSTINRPRPNRRGESGHACEARSIEATTVYLLPLTKVRHSGLHAGYKVRT